MSDVDIEQPGELVRYLQREGRIDPGETPEVTVLGGGVSCKTVRVRSSAGSWVLKQALPRLRVEADWRSDPERMHIEALAMNRLARLVPGGAIVPLVFEDRALHLIAMEAVPEPHEQWKKMLLAGRLDRAHVRSFAAMLAAIHAGSRDSPELPSIFDRRDFFEQLRLEAYYAFSGEQIPACRAFMAGLIDETRRHRVCLVHGDYSPKNVLVHDGRLVLLDHEVVHWGDGAFDIGFATTHFLAKALHIPGLRNDFLAAATLLWEVYSETVSGPMAQPGYEARAARHLVGCLLARAVGRSPLEYLGYGERRVQARAAVELAADPPRSIAGVIASFGSLLDAPS